jgi:hypothetical protein
MRPVEVSESLTKGEFSLEVEVAIGRLEPNRFEKKLAAASTEELGASDNLGI